MSDQREVVRAGNFLIARDPQFLNQYEYDLFRVELEDGKERLFWLMSVSVEESNQLISALRMISGES